MTRPAYQDDLEAGRITVDGAAAVVGLSRKAVYEQVGPSAVRAYYAARDRARWGVDPPRVVPLTEAAHREVIRRVLGRELTHSKVRGRRSLRKAAQEARTKAGKAKSKVPPSCRVTVTQVKHR